MTSLTLTLMRTDTADLDLSGLTPDALAGKTRDQLRRLRVPNGTRRVALGELFDIAGTADGESLQLRGLSRACHRVGYGLESGLIEAAGEVGDEFGAGMSGGQVRLRGHCGNGAGAGMRGGVLRVSGNAGHRLGGMLTGQTRGMNEGTILIGGSAGDSVGERMRRGLIVVAGDSGAAAGERMIAGTIVIGGRCGDDVGAGMRRGSILLAQAPNRMSAMFNPSGEFEFGFIHLLARHVHKIEPRSGRLVRRFARARRWSGDMAYGGKGEILVAPAAG